MSFEIKPCASIANGRTFYDDAVARAADVGEDRFLMTCSGHSVECHALEIVEAANALARRVGGRLSILEAVRAVLDDIEARIPADAA